MAIKLPAEEGVRHRLARFPLYHEWHAVAIGTTDLIPGAVTISYRTGECPQWVTTSTHNSRRYCKTVRLQKNCYSSYRNNCYREDKKRICTGVRLSRNKRFTRSRKNIRD